METNEARPQPDDGAVRIVVVQQNRLLCQALVRALEGESDLEVVAEAGPTADVPAVASDAEPDLVICDIPTLETVGTDLLTSIRSAAPNARILVIGDRVDPSRVERIVIAGVDGFTLTSVTLSDFVDTVRRVGQGEVVLHPGIAELVVRSVSEFALGRRAGPVLTQRQDEVLQLMAQGLGNKQIARRLGIGVETVKTHISRVLDKLDAATRTEAVTSAVREGLLTPARLDAAAASSGRAARW